MPRLVAVTPPSIPLPPPVLALPPRPWRAVGLPPVLCPPEAPADLAMLRPAPLP